MDKKVEDKKIEDKKVDNNKNSSARKRQNVPQGRSTKAAIVWLIIFVAIGSMLLFRDFTGGKATELNQSEFETFLASKRIINANIISEADSVLSVEGEFISSTPDVANLEANKDTKKQLTSKYTTRLLRSEKLSELLANTSVEIKNSNAGIWNFLLMGILPVVLLVGLIYLFTNKQMKMAGKGAMDFGKSRARMIMPDDLNIKFDDIAGADEAKEEIQEVVEYLKDPTKFLLLGGQIPKGCLLVGPPGTGKTLLAKAVASEAGVPFFAISGSDFMEMFVGVGASRVRDMFEQARKNLPSLIFIDEIDAIGRARFSGIGGGHDEREQTLNAMLVEMDGLESHNGVIVIAATNRPDVLDSALLRPGRFDRQVVMDLPDIAGRRKILDVHVKRIKVADNIDLDAVAKGTPGFSGAELANLCNEAALLAARHNREAVIQADLEEARDKVCYGRERRSRKISDRERKLTAYHEAGHALIALHKEHCTPLHKVTIIPRGQAYLGATFTMPKEDVYTKSMLELKAEMVMSMGGRVAEEIVIGDITTGAAGDIGHASSIAKHMVCTYGMSEKLGPIKYADGRSHVHVRADVMPEDLCSQDTIREVDIEVKALVTAALEEARVILKKNSDQLEILAQGLLEHETMSREEIDKLLNLTSASDL